MLKNSTCELNIREIGKSGKGIISMKTFQGYVITDKNKSVLQYVPFNSGRCLFLNYSLEKLATTFKLREELLKKEKNHNEIQSDTWRSEKYDCLDYVKNDVLRTIYSYARFSNKCKL